MTNDSASALGASALVASAASDPAVCGVYRVDLVAGSAARVAPTAGLGCLVAHPTRARLYGLSGDSDGDSLTTWAVGDALAPLARTPLIGSGACCAAVVDDHLVVTSYDSGHVTSLPLDADGVPGAGVSIRLEGAGPDPDRQRSAHPHHALADGSDVLITDLGSDCIWRADAASLDIRSRLSLAAGSGPRHSAWLGQSPDGSGERRLAVTGELEATVMTATRDAAAGTVASTSRSADARIYPSDVARHPAGFVVVANRGVDTIAVFRERPLELTRLHEVSCGGIWPLNLEIVGDRVVVTNRDSDSVVVFALDVVTGMLAVERTIAVPRPTWVTR